MHTRSRKAAMVLGLAAAHGLGMFHANEGEGGGGGGNPAPEGKGKKTEAPPEPEKLTLTKDELKAQIDGALADQKRKADDAARKKQEDDDRAKAEEEGKWKELHTTEKTKRAEAEARAQAAELRLSVFEHIAEHKPELAKAAKLIARTVDLEAAKDDADKAIKAAVAEYEKTLPEAPKGGGAPAAQPRTANRVAGQQGNQTEKPNNGNQPARPLSAAASRV